MHLSYLSKEERQRYIYIKKTLWNMWRSGDPVDPDNYEKLMEELRSLIWKNYELWFDWFYRTSQN